LLQDISIPDADKALIRNMLTKPWNLHIYRHSALTEKSQFLTEAVQLLLVLDQLNHLEHTLLIGHILHPDKRKNTMVKY
jgi:hypothetical protein